MKEDSKVIQCRLRARVMAPAMLTSRGVSVWLSGVPVGWNPSWRLGSTTG